ncbi:MAG: ankyrin repeat domain-containing protein, partial [Gammaproteobacteria bacterium]|nr:ankyrin repeat domain-containing protein [Gammaproteobacteria bacterium]
MRSPLAILLLALAAAAAALPLHAQVPPTAAEAAAYQGLHAAAQRGDVAAIEQLATSKAALAARDSAGRTPLHVATFARRPQAVQALLRAGADPAAFEQGRYDAVT